jgi:hypothetical protein
LLPVKGADVYSVAGHETGADVLLTTPWGWRDPAMLPSFWNVPFGEALTEYGPYASILVCQLRKADWREAGSCSPVPPVQTAGGGNTPDVSGPWRLAIRWCDQRLKPGLRALAAFSIIFTIPVVALCSLVRRTWGAFIQAGATQGIGDLRGNPRHPLD